MSKLAAQGKWMGVSALALAVLACAPAPAPAPAPLATPTPASSATPTLAPSPYPTPTASASPSGPGLAGTVYDLDGKPVDGGTVTVTSLDAATPFTRSTPVGAGRYALAGLPADANLQVVASKPNWTSRRRVLALAAGTTTLDFGAPDFKGDAAPFFISDLPEITQVAPIPDGALADPNSFHFVLSTSTPLDATNQQRLASALRVMSAENEALADTEDKGFPADVSLVSFGASQLKVGDLFRGDVTAPATLVWNADGTQATFDFKAQPQAKHSTPTRYQIALAAGPAPIVDGQGHQLGTAPDGSFNGYPAAGHLVHSVFQAADLRLADVPGLAPGSREARWAATHDDAGRFVESPDFRAPRLTGATLSATATDTVFVLFFDEPLIGYDGTVDGHRGDGLDPTAANFMRFTFALGQHRDDLADLKLTGRDADTTDPRAQQTFGAEGDRHRETQFPTTAFVISPGGAANGSLFLAVDPKDPRRVTLTILGLPHWLNPDVHELAVRVEGVGDATGNDISRDQADASVFQGSI